MPTLPSDPLDLAILLYGEGEQRQIARRNVTVVLPALLDFSEVETALDSYDLLVSANEPLRKIEFALPNTFFFTLAELMEHPARRITPPVGFYLADIGYRHVQAVSTPPAAVRQYLDAATVFGLLRRVADHDPQMAGRVDLVFLAKEKLVIVPDYCPEDLQPLDSLSELEREFFQDETHHDQKKTILRTVLHELFGTRGTIRFADLLASFGEIADRAKRGYDFYVAEFSFERIKRDVEKEKAEFTTRLNKVFSDIQNQLLAIPAALILVGGQMQPAGKFRISNLMIWLGTLIFSILMDLLIRNQRHTLFAIKHEFDLQWKKIGEEKYRFVAGNFEEAYKQIRCRYDHQHILLWVIDGLVAASLLLTSFLLLWHSGWTK